MSGFINTFKKYYIRECVDKILNVDNMLHKMAYR